VILVTRTPSTKYSHAPATAKHDLRRWEPERPDAKSLRLLPSGSDRVGDGTVRPTPAAHMGEGR